MRVVNTSLAAGTLAASVLLLTLGTPAASAACSSYSAVDVQTDASTTACGTVAVNPVGGAESDGGAAVSGTGAASNNEQSVDSCNPGCIAVSGTGPATNSTGA